MTRLPIKWACAVAMLVLCAGVARGQAIISITPPGVLSGEVGVFYNGQFTASDTVPDGPFTFTSPQLPQNGLSLSAAGFLSGTPIAAGPITFSVTATDSNGSNVSQITITIAAAPTISPTSLPGGDAGPYNQTLTASGGTPGYTWSSSGSLPTGTTLNSSTGTISGSAAAGTYNFTITVTDSAGGTASQPYTVVINPLPSVSTTTLPEGEATAAYNPPSGAALSATGGAPPYTWSVSSGTLPSGLALSSGGVISGTLSASAATATFAVQVTDSLLVPSAPQSLTLTVIAAPAITTGSPLPQGEVGAPYSQTLSASGGTNTGFSFSITSGSLPAGLSLSPAGVISGTPTTPVTSASFTVKVTDSAAGFSSKAFTLTVTAGPTINTASTLPQGEVNAPYPSGTNLMATGGTNTGFTWSIVSGSLPAGVTLSPAGLISGTPTESGPFNFTAKVTDSAGGFGTQAFSMTIIAGPTITTAPILANGTVGVSYGTLTLAATGGTPGYKWSIAQGSLPAGLTFDGNAGTISGTPSANGTFNFTVQVSDAKNVTNTKVFTITVASGLTIVTAPSLPNGTIGQPYTLTLMAQGGTTPYTWAVTSGALPGGLSLSGSGSITGTPTSNGTLSFTVQVTDSNSVAATKQFTLTVASSLNITNAPTLPAGVVGGQYSQTLNATGGTSPYSWVITAGALPGGLNFSSSGTISGKPTAGGTFSFTVTVTDSTSLTATKSFSLSIAALLAISTQPALPSGGVGTSYTQTLTAVGGTAPYTWSVSAGSLPGGLNLSPASGTISGAPTTVGNFSFTVQVTDNNSVTATKGFTLSIVSALTITTAPTLPGGAVGVAYAQSVVVVGGNAPYTWSTTSGAPPAGLTLAPTSGAISGTPTSAGNFTFTVQVTDSASVTVNKAFSISVVAGLTITTAPVLPSDSVGVSYTVTLAAAGGSTPYTWAVTAGGLPGGLVLDAKSGAIFGTPTASGSFGFTVGVTDSASNTSSKQFSIAVAAGLTITTAPVLSNGAIGATYSQALDAAGGSAPYHWSITQGALPAGLTLDPSSGAISGTASASGSFNFTVQVTDSASATATKQFSLAISASLAITTPGTLPNGSIGAPYSVTFGVAGGSGPYQWTVSAGTLPGGMSLSSASGALSGTPVSAGTFSFTVTVTDSAAHASSQQFSLTVASGLVISTPAQLPGGSVGNAYSQTLKAAGGTPAYRWALAAGSTLPPGLGLSPGGVISGKPTANGAFKFTIQVADNAGATASLQFSLSVGSGLAITSPSTLSPGTLGQAYASLVLAAAGGSGPYTWSITTGTLAPGLSLSTSGAISGTPTAAGTFNITVQVTDSNGATASQPFSISVIPPTLPQVNVSGVPESASSAQQINFNVALASGYPLDITGTITLSFTPDAVAPADDPAIQFSTGGRTANFKITANTTKAVFSAPQIAFQTGTVSGTVTLSFTLQAGGTELPSIGNRTITIARTAPAISSVKLVTSSNGFQVQVTGFSTPRELTEADLTFTAAAGANLQTTSAIIDLTEVGKQWFQSTTSAQFGSQFILVMPFTASQGSISAVASVTVTLKNSQGTSPSASAHF